MLLVAFWLEGKILSWYSHNPEAFCHKNHSRMRVNTVVNKLLYPSLPVLEAKLAFGLDEELGF